MKIERESTSEQLPGASPQHRCLSYVLRNGEVAIRRVRSSVECNEGVLDPAQLANELRVALAGLEEACRKLEHGVLCPLSPEQCAFVGPIVGCMGRQSVKALQLLEAQSADESAPLAKASAIS
ncbi:MAG: hypothetical protein J5J00_14420 [Deltaproteobacteria bacterium]|nr:hypothetical protein [Deltaproteobacteria bacterium]